MGTTFDVELRRIAADLSILASRALLAAATYDDGHLAAAGRYLEREADELRRVAERLDRRATIAGGADSATVEPGPSVPPVRTGPAPSRESRTDRST